MGEAPKKHYNGLVLAKEEIMSNKDFEEDIVISKLLSGYHKFEKRKLKKPEYHFQNENVPFHITPA